jgi:hypothetical protein
MGRDDYNDDYYHDEDNRQFMDEDYEVHSAMTGDQEADDFANFDPKKYMNRRRTAGTMGGAPYGDSREEQELGRSRRSRRAASDDEDLGSARSRRSGYQPRYAGMGSPRTERDPRRSVEYESGGGFDLGGMLSDLVPMLFSLGPMSRPILLTFGCVIIALVLAICGCSAWVVIQLRG